MAQILPKKGSENVISCNVWGLTPLPLHKFCRSVQLLEKQSLDPLQWCRNLSLCVENVDLSNARTASTAELISILLRCNHLRRVKIYLKFNNDDDLLGFRLIWGLILLHLSKQQLSVHLNLRVETELSRYDYPFDALRENLIALSITTKRPLADCIPRGELSQFTRLQSLEISPSADADHAYTSSENSLFWNEVQKLQLKHLRIVSRYPALTWNRHDSAVLPTSLRTLQISFFEEDDFSRNPLVVIRQLPNLETLELLSLYDREEDGSADNAGIHQPGYHSCPLCQQPVLTTFRLTRLNVTIECPSPAFRDIVLASPLLEYICFPRDFSNDDIVSTVSACKTLKEVEFCESERVNSHGLVFLCKAKTLESIDLQVLQWDLVRPALEHWAMQLPLLTLLPCGSNDGNVKDFIEWSRHRSWNSINRENLLSGYGTSSICCLEKEARDIILPNKPRWGPENLTAMDNWIRSFVRYDGSEDLDMVAMRSDLMSDGDYYR